jgi:hypothetical protein
MALVYNDTAGNTSANDGLTLNVWIDALQSRLPGATTDLIRSELLAAIREFYFQSNAWREQIGPFRVTSGDDLVWLNPADAYSDVKWVHGCALRLEDDNSVIYLTPLSSRPLQVRSDRPTHYHCADPYTIRLWPVPDQDYGNILYVDATLVPLPDATRLPNIAVSHHFEAILEYALARIFSIPNKPWTDRPSGLQYLLSARRRAVQFRDIADRGYTKMSNPQRFPSFA